MWPFKKEAEAGPSAELTIKSLRPPLSYFRPGLWLVTPKGVAKKVPRVEARPESICKLDLAKIDLRKRVKATKREV
jgi:hypothetical protein